MELNIPLSDNFLPLSQTKWDIDGLPEMERGRWTGNANIFETKTDSIKILAVNLCFLFVFLDNS